MDWQAVPIATSIKRKKKEKKNSSSSDSYDTLEPVKVKRKNLVKHSHPIDGPTTPTHHQAALADNSFAILSSDDDDDEMFDDLPAKTPLQEKEMEKPKAIKPPPIFIPDVTNIKALVNSIAGVLGKDVEFHLIRQATTTFA